MNGGEPEDSEPIPPPSGRLEGRIRACEGILRTLLGQRRSEAGSRALSALRNEQQEQPVSHLSQPSNETHIEHPTPAGPLKRTATRKLAKVLATRSEMRVLKHRKRVISKWVYVTGGIAAAGAVLLIGCYFRYIEMPARSVQVTLQEVHGTVLIAGAADARTAKVGDRIAAGQKIMTQGDSSASLEYPDGSHFEMPGDSTLELEASDDYHKALNLSKGSFTAHVAPQTVSGPLVVATPAAKIEVLGTRFSLSAEADAASLDVESGKVRMTRNADKQSVQVGAGYSCVAATGVAFAPKQLRFVKGINFGGRSVVIDGNRWLSQKEALAEGLNIPGRLSVWDHEHWMPDPPTDAETTALVQSGIFSNESAGDGPLIFTQKLENGEYRVFLWSNENVKDYIRSLSVSLQGQKVASGIGVLQVRHWAKYGPYAAQVNDGYLTVEIDSARRFVSERHICGIAIFKLGE